MPLLVCRFLRQAESEVSLRSSVVRTTALWPAFMGSGKRVISPPVSSIDVWLAQKASIVIAVCGFNTRQYSGPTFAMHLSCMLYLNYTSR